jgi:hypothetical protein
MVKTQKGRNTNNSWQRYKKGRNTNNSWQRHKKEASTNNESMITIHKQKEK